MQIPEGMPIGEYLAGLVRQERLDYEEARRKQALRPRTVRRQTGATIVYSIRLDKEEVDALELRAAALDMKPTALARSYIRSGLMARGDDRVAGAIDRLDAAIEELRGFS